MRATIAYYDPPERPAPGVRPDFTRLPLSAKPVTVADMRDRGGSSPGSPGSLDREGFTLVTAPSGVRDFYDRADVLRTYAAETGELLRGLTGCAATAMLNSPVVRVSGRAGERPAGTTFTGDFAHADFSAAAAQYMLRRNLPPDEAEARLRNRYSVFNIWRAFSGPPQDVPLALCDTRTVAAADKQYCLITMKSAISDEMVTWENITYLHSDRHRWWYCADMTRDEAYVFRSFDSDPARAEQVPHSAFADPSCPASAPPRASIEIRMFAFYDEPAAVTAR
jgi:hypothetical protein